MIGIADYQAVQPLPAVVRQDARDVADTLGDRSLCAYGTTPTLLLDREATKSAILAALDSVAKSATARSHVFLYFSGHGHSVTDHGGTTDYLLPFDTDLATADSCRATAIASEEFQNALRAIQAKTLLVVLDCCHAGGLADPQPARAGSRPAGPWWKDLRGLPESYYQALSEGSRVVLAACGSNELSWAEDGGRNSLFTGCLLAGLQGAVESNDEFIRVFDLFDYVSKEVQKKRESQRPLFKAALQANFPVALRLGGQRAARAYVPSAASALDGVAAFLDLVRNDPEIRGSISSYRTQFLSICDNIKRIATYKHLHDELQQLENLQSLVAPSLAGHDVNWETLDTLRRLIAGKAEEVQRAAQAANGSTGTAPVWQKTLTNAVQAIAKAIQESDRAGLERAWREIDGLFAQVPPRVNVRMIEAAQTLRLQPLRDALQEVQTRLRGRGASVNASQVTLFAESVETLRRQEAALQALLAVHEAMQEADGTLRSLEPFVRHGGSVDDVIPRWRVLGPSLDSICRDGEFKWVDRLRQAASAFSTAIGTRNIDTVSLARRDLCDALRVAFNQVDATVKELCARLQDDIQTPLAPALALLAAS